MYQSDRHCRWGVGGGGGQGAGFVMWQLSSPPQYDMCMESGSDKEGEKRIAEMHLRSVKSEAITCTSRVKRIYLGVHNDDLNYQI